MKSMRKLIVLLLVATFIGGMRVNAQDASRFFEKEDLIVTGAFYYPEHWNENQWDRDLKNIADMGFTYVHMAEFAWAFLEPEEGKYDFQWLDKVVDLAGKHGLKVMLCTPTATLPVWMGIKYPEVYMMNSNHIRSEHGTRQIHSLANPKYQELSFKIVTELAKRYGKNPNVWGWQLDNEPEPKEDYSPSANEAFRAWVKNKYKTIDQLNEAWGTAFWCLTYSSFDEVNLHNSNLVGWWGSNPHALLDYRRFNADLEAEFLNTQAEILRKYISPEQFITTNYAGVVTNADPRRANKLDFPAFTSYPNGGSANLGEQGFRLGSYTALMQYYDYYRHINGVTGVMEIQPGQVNWGSVNPLLMPGALRMWLWHGFAAGGKFASSYRYRQILYGVEQYHAGIMKNDGVTPSQGGKEYMQFNNEIKALRKEYDPKAKMPEMMEKRSSAILWSHDNLWDQNRQPQSNQWSLWGHTLKYHKLLKSAGAPVDYISEADDFSKYKMLIVPAYQAIDSILVKKLEKYASNGGILVMTSRTGMKQRNGHFWEAGWCAPIYDLIGASIEEYDMLPSWGNGSVDYNGNTYKWNNWGDLLVPSEGTEVLATYSNQFYKGKAAIVGRKIGKGSVTYIGVDTDDASLEKSVLTQLFARNGITVTNCPEGVYVYWRDGFMVAVNYNSTEQKIALPGNAKILIGNATLPPAGVVVWKE